MKCQKHGVSLQEIEEFFFQTRLYVAPDIKHSQDEERFLAVGRSSAGKPMFVVFTLRNHLIRPISARYMHQKEAKQYEQIFT
ncbi:MAG: BrnT family toxin [Chloroflexaceae bacterium]|nr:BrnT family toxin [Chloroflexaceae bacterium]